MARQQPESGISPAAVLALMTGDIENAVTAMTPGGIEAQEKAGQAALVASSSLPRETPNDPRERFEKLGFVFGDVVDDLFVKCTLPAGWTKKATEHDMHSVILDEQGRERVSVFYKAAFYDRRADMQLNLRYRLSGYEAVEGQPDMRACRFIDYDGTVVREFGMYKLGTATSYAESCKLDDEARAWAYKEYPDLENPLAYW